MLRFFFGLKNFFVGQMFSAHVNRSLNWESLKSLRFLPEITVILDKHWFLEETHMFLAFFGKIPEGILWILPTCVVMYAGCFRLHSIGK